MSATIQGAVHELIVVNADVAAILTPAGSQPLLYPNKAPHWKADEERDRYAVYWIVSTSRDQHLGGTNKLTMHRIQVDSFGRTYDDAHDLSEKIRLSCDGFSGSVAVGEEFFNLRYMRWDNATDGYVDSASGGRGWHGVNADYNVWYRAGTPVFAR